MFTNENEQGYFYMYFVNTNLKSELHSIPSGQIHDVILVSSDLIMIAHETGLLRYTFNNNSLVNVVPGEQFSKLNYDPLNGVLLASNGNQLKYYSLLGDPLGWLITQETLMIFIYSTTNKLI